MTSAKTMQRYWRRLKAILLTQFSIWVAGLAMACGSIIGGQIGPRLQGTVSQRAMERGIGYLFLVIGLSMAFIAIRNTFF
mgnify:CR=1 FL=1